MEIQVFSKSDIPYGRTYGEWTAKWWQWIMAIPKERSPLHDLTGEHWDVDQPSSDVWFLAGNFARKDEVFPHRKIKIKSGRSFLLPVLNCASSFLTDPDLKTHEELLCHVEDDVNSVVKNELFINGTWYEPVRVQSDPRIFRMTINKDNAFEIKNSGLTEAAADGYWAFLKPDLRGSYTIRFEGSCENGRLKAGATYDLEIV